MRYSTVVVGALPVLCCAGLTVGQLTAGAALVDPQLTNSTSYDGWVGLTAVNYPSGYGSFPGFGPWAGGVGSNRTPGNVFNASEPGDAELLKISDGAGGGPYLAGQSVYSGGTSVTPNTLGGTLSFADATPVANLETVVFQIQIAGIFGFDFFNNQLPTFNYNDGSQNLSAGLTTTIDTTVNGVNFGEPIVVETILMQWDLSGIPGTINDFSIDFNTVQHSQIYSARIDQSDTFTVAVPAPGALALLGLGGLAAARRRR